MTTPDGPGTVVARAPGRVNLIGDHTDYCEGLALPMAIDRWTEVAYAPDGSRRLVITTDADRRPATVDLADPPGARTGPGSQTGGGPGGDVPAWAQLAAAVVGLVAPARGGRVTVRSTVPVGAGLSSSAAFSVALALALGAGGSPMTVARLCQRAEAVAGSAVGLLDPLAIAAARQGHALAIDFSTLAVVHVPVPGDAEVVVVHSGVARRVGASPYATRRHECAAAAARIGRPLGAADDDDVAALAGTLRRRARHVVSECRRVRAAAAAFGSGDLAAVGRLMTESHRSLAVDFEASVPAVDALVADLAGRPGVYGARMTGAGFGGCVVALARQGAVDPAAWPGRAWVVHPAGGAIRQGRPAVPRTGATAAGGTGARR